MNKDKPLWDAFPKLTEIVLRDHQEKRIKPGHGFFHTLMVAQYGPIIADEKRIGVLAWIAGMCHNTDRIFPQNCVEDRVRYYLESETDTIINTAEEGDIIEAVIHHSELNSPDDNPVTIVLKDADRLGNAGVICPIRAGQGLYNKPLFNPKPTDGAIFGDEKTALDSMKITLEWEEMLRSPKAKKLGQKYFEELRRLIRSIEARIKETGINNFPVQL